MDATMKYDEQPGFMFYVKDWLADLGLRLCSLGAQGLWINMCCIMWLSKKRGVLQVNGEKLTCKGLAELVGKDEKEVGVYLKELKDNVVLSELEGGNIINRRMYKKAMAEEKKTQAKRRAAVASNIVQGNHITDPSMVDTKDEVDANEGSPQKDISCPQDEVDTKTVSTDSCPLSKKECPQEVSTDAKATQKQRRGEKKDNAEKEEGKSMTDGDIDSISDMLVSMSQTQKLTQTSGVHDKTTERIINAKTPLSYSIAFAFAFASSIAYSEKEKKIKIKFPHLWNDIERLTLVNKAEIIRKFYWSYTGKRGKKSRIYLYLATHTKKKPWLKQYTFREIIKSIEIYVMENIQKVEKGYAYEPQNFFSIDTPDFTDYLTNATKKIKKNNPDKSIKGLRSTGQFQQYSEPNEVA